jgi:hypothetical protein
MFTTLWEYYFQNEKEDRTVAFCFGNSAVRSVVQESYQESALHTGGTHMQHNSTHTSSQGAFDQADQYNFCLNPYPSLCTLTVATVQWSLQQ